MLCIKYNNYKTRMWKKRVFFIIIEHKLRQIKNKMQLSITFSYDKLRLRYNRGYRALKWNLSLNYCINQSLQKRKEIKVLNGNFMRHP